MIKIYFASNTPNRFGVQLLIKHVYNQCSSEGIEVIANSTWHNDAPLITSTFGERVNQDIDELCKSDMIIAMYPFGKGTLSEMSIALGRDIPSIALIPPEFVINPNSISDWSDNFPLAKYHVWDNTFLEKCRASETCMFRYKQLIVTDWESIGRAILFLQENYLKE